MTKTPLIVCSLVLTLYGFDVGSSVMAQGGDCGNGLIQQLYVGVAAWVIPEPPQPVNVRDIPGGKVIGQIQPGENFTVLAGPECNQTYSWWQIESTTGQRGWVAEGTDRYFIEPLEAASGVGRGGGGTEAELNDNLSVIVDADSCTDAAQFEVGDSVRVTDANAASFYGHPLIDKGLFSTIVMSEYYIQFSVYPFEFYADQVSEAYVIDGPYCVNGDYVYKLGTLGKADEGDTTRPYVANTQAAFWFYQQDIVVGERLQSQPAFEPVIYDLKHADSAPIVDLEQQVGFAGFGGGGEEAINYWNAETCGLGDNYTGIGFETLLAVMSMVDAVSDAPCMEIYPVPSGSAHVKVFQPDGTLFFEYETETHTLHIYRDLANEALDVIETTSVQVDVPNDIGLMSGIWEIEVEVGGTSTHRAYSLINDDLTRIQAFCDGMHPRFWMNGFAPRQKLDLVYVGLSKSAPAEIITINGEAPFDEIDRWNVQMDDTGRLLVDVGFLPERSGYMVAVEPGARWQTGLESVTNGSPGNYAADLIVPCYPLNTETAMIEPNRFAVGIGAYTFTVNTQDTVRVSSMTYRDRDWRVPNLRLSLELIAPDGTMIANSDTGEIDRLALPQSGNYQIRLSATGDIGEAGLFIDLQPGVAAAVPVVNLEYNLPVSAELDAQSHWVFEGHMGDRLTITIDADGFDPIVSLRDANETELVRDDDSGDNLNSQITFTLPQDGLYTIEVSAWNEKTGEYTLEVSR